MKKCFRCNSQKGLENFYKHPGKKDGLLGKCKECTKNDVKNNRSIKIEYYKKYEKNRNTTSIDRILDHRYAMLKRRSINTECRTYKVFGKKFLSKKDFLEWSQEPANMEKLNAMIKKWKKNNYDIKFSPSIDRIDSKMGYERENIQWLTHQQNSKKYNK